MVATLKPFDLTHVQFVLLASLWWLSNNEDGEINQSRLADFAQTDKMMTSQVLNVLTRRELVKRQRSEIDGRAFALILSLAGNDLVRRALPEVEQADAAFFQLSLENASSLTSALTTLSSDNKSVSF